MTNERSSRMRWRRHRQEFWPNDEMLRLAQRHGNVLVPLVHGNIRFIVYQRMTGQERPFRHLYWTLTGQQ